VLTDVSRRVSITILSPNFEVETFGISFTILGLRPTVIYRYAATKYKYYLR